MCTQLEVNESANPGKYLGMPMRIVRQKILVFGFLIDRVERKLQMWNIQKIFKAGEVILLKTAAQYIPNFWMSLLLVPLDVCNAIEKKMNAYWWGGKEGQNSIKWVVGEIV